MARKRAATNSSASGVIGCVAAWLFRLLAFMLNSYIRMDIRSTRGAIEAETLQRESTPCFFVNSIAANVKPICSDASARAAPP